MAIKTSVLEGAYFEFDPGGNYVNNINQLTIKGYPGLTFCINDSFHLIMIYSADGVWSWNINNEVPLKCLKFNPSTLIEGEPVLITTL